MVVKMMRWRPWPPLVTKKYHVRLNVKKLIGCNPIRQSSSKLALQIKWKGPKSTLSSLRRGSVARNFTKEAVMEYDDVSGGFVVNFDEEFHNLCNLNGYNKDNVLFHPWEIAFNLFHVCVSFSYFFPSFLSFSFHNLII